MDLAQGGQPGNQDDRTTLWLELLYLRTIQYRPLQIMFVILGAHVLVSLLGMTLLHSSVEHAQMPTSRTSKHPRPELNA